MNVYTARIEGEDEAHHWYAWGEDEAQARARLIEGMTRGFENAIANENWTALSLAKVLGVLTRDRAIEIEDEDVSILPAEIEHFRQALDAAITPMALAGHDWVWL